MGAVYMWCKMRCCLTPSLLMGDGDARFLAKEDLMGREYCEAKAAAGGQTSVATGICLGMGTRLRKSCSYISARFMRLVASTVRHLRMKSLA